MASARWSSPMGCSRLTSWPSGFVGSSTVRITSTCPFPKVLPDRALGSVVVVSSTYLPAWSFSPALREGGGQVRRTSEALAYPIALLLASYLLASQILFF